MKSCSDLKPYFAPGLSDIMNFKLYFSSLVKPFICTDHLLSLTFIPINIEFYSDFSKNVVYTCKLSSLNNRLAL